MGILPLKKDGWMDGRTDEKERGKEEGSLVHEELCAKMMMLMAMMMVTMTRMTTMMTRC